MIRKLVRQMLVAQVLSALTVSLCLLIDNIMIGRFLGEEGIAAYGLANPLLLAIGAVGSLLAAGIQVTCSKSLGRGAQEETHEAYSSALVVTGAVSLAFLLAVQLFSPFLARAMGAGTSGTLFEETAAYLRGFSLGAPASMGALVLIPFLQIAGQSSLLIAAVLTMTVTDIALDLLNALVFHGGMFGMGLASSLSYYAALIVAAFYFLSKKCVYRFSFARAGWKKTGELFAGGIPTGFNMASSVILVLLMNRILGGAGSAANLAAFAVITTLGNTANCITTGIGSVSLTLGGIFFNEEDRTTLKHLVRLLCRYSILLGLSVGIMLALAAEPLVSLFIPEPGASRDLAVLGLRLFAGGLIPCCINNTLKYLYQACGRTGLTELLSMLEGAVFPLIVAFVLSRFFGAVGAWFYFPLGELITLLFIGLLIRRLSGRHPWEAEAALLLREDFGVKDDELLERDIRTLEDAAAAARDAGAFCARRGQDAHTVSHLSLCIEEMSAYTLLHGFSRDQKEHHLFVRVLHKPDRWVLRFRDDCFPFDPLHYLPETDGDSAETLGLRMILKMADNAAYTYSMNLNNLTLTLPAAR